MGKMGDFLRNISPVWHLLVFLTPSSLPLILRTSEVSVSYKKGGFDSAILRAQCFYTKRAIFLPLLEVEKRPQSLKPLALYVEYLIFTHGT